MVALLDEAAAPERLFPAPLNALQDHGETTTILVFEDVHWAGNATLDLVKYLGRRVSLLRLRSEPWPLSPAETRPARENQVVVLRKLGTRPEA